MSRIRGGRRAAIAGLATALLCVAGAVEFGAGSIGGDQAPIVIADISLTVPGSDLLTPQTAGANAAAKVINAEGGFGGRQVKIITCNSMDTPSVAATCAHQTIADHPIAMIGCEPNWAQAGLPIYKQAGTPSFNCLNTGADFTDKYSFGLQAGGFGELRGMANWLCTQKSIHTVTEFAADIPDYRAAVPVAAGSVLQGCGKTVNYVYIPPSVTDPTSYVTQVVQTKPDFVQSALFTGPSTIIIYRLFAQDGIPPNHISSSSTSVTKTFLAQAGGALNGTYSVYQYDSWSDTSNPQVATYLKAMKGASVDGHDESPETSYANVMWIYDVAKKIGFAKFTPAALEAFMNSPKNNGLPMPLALKLTIPGPSGYAQVRQPDVQIEQWTGTALKPVTKGTKKGGWISGYITG